MLAGLAIYFLIGIASGVFATLYAILVSLFYSSRGDYLLYLLAPVLIIAFTVAVAWVILSQLDRWAEKVVGPTCDEQPGQPVAVLPAAFRMVSVFSGLLCLYWLVPRIISAVQGYIIARQHNFDYASAKVNPTHILAWAIQAALAIYLLFGAPHFVRWQVKKTLEHCRGPAEEGTVEGGQ